jgi:hypothetical protein
MRRIPPLALLLLAACSDAGGSTDAVVVRDSAGVRIVESRGDVWTAPEQWRLAAGATVRIGEIDGDAPYLFSAISGIVPLSDGRIVVADGGSRTLRWFGPQGAFLFERGGAGDGPGEFSSFGGLSVAAGDTLVVFDPAAQRWAIWTPDGDLAATAAAPGMLRASGHAHRLRNGSFVLLHLGSTPSANSAGRPHRMPATLLSVAAPGSAVDTIGTFPGAEVYRQQDGRFAAPYFQRGFSWTAGEDRVYAGPQDPFEIRVHSAGGEWIRSIRAPDVDLTLGRDQVDAFRTWMTGRLDGRPAEQRAAMIRQLDERLEEPMPDRVPAYSALLLDPHGNLWVGEYRFELNLHPPERWLVFDPEGRLLTLVRMPPRFALLAVGNDHVFGRLTDELNVQYVAAFRIER